MTIEEIKQVVLKDSWFKDKPYSFIHFNEHLGKNIIMLGLGGSYAYGTNTETSDIDVRGCALNSKMDILTNQNFEQVQDNPTDTTIYSFNKLIFLLTNVNPNVIESLGLKPEHYLYLSPIGQELINNRKMFLSKKCIHSFGGYAASQLYRLSQREKHSMGQAQLEAHILKTMEFMKTDFANDFSIVPDDALNLYIDKSDRPEMETEIFMDVRLTHYPLRDYCGMWNTLRNVTKQYNSIGKRNDHAIEHGKLGKHMMHLCRLYLMCFDILEKEEIITYREKEHDFLMEVRNGKYLTEDNQVLSEFYDIVNEYEKRLEYAKENTSLPAKPDYKAINEFMASVNERVITGVVSYSADKCKMI